MSISPFSARPASPEGERRRARLAVAIATVGIVATLLAYAISPGVRHAVGHAAHSVKHAVSHVFDHDHAVHPRAKQPVRRTPANVHAQHAAHPRAKPPLRRTPANVHAQQAQPQTGAP